jgi:hypothetical protein
LPGNQSASKWRRDGRFRAAPASWHDRRYCTFHRPVRHGLGHLDSFIGISKAHTTNLAVVAPGIAEALLATALGLVAAIPAVMIYNVLARSTAHYRALIGDASALIMNLVSRDLDRGSRAYQAAE